MKTKRSSRIRPLVAACGFAIVLAGCTAPTTLPEFERDATAEDAFPSGVLIPDDLDIVHSRLVDEHEDVQLFLLSVTGGQPGYCLAAVTPGERHPTMACSGHSGGSVESNVAPRFAASYVMPPDDESVDWDHPTESVWVAWG